MKKYIIILKDNTGEYGPIYLTQFKDGAFGTTPNIKNAFQCTEDEADFYQAKAQDIANKTMTNYGISEKLARKAEKCEL